MPVLQTRPMILIGAVALLLTPLAGRGQSPPETAPAMAPASEPTTAPATASAPAIPPELREPLDLVPADSLLCWYARPFPDTQAPGAGTPSPLQTLITLGARLANPALDARARMWARGIDAFGLAIRFPHVFVLVDASAKAAPDNPEIKRGDRIRFAMIVRTGDQDAAFARVIQATINEQTDQAKARLEKKQAGRWSYMELQEQRLPEWCTIAWGRLDDYFVLTVGPEVWPTIAAVALGQEESLSRTPWLVESRAKRGRDALIEIIVRSEAIRDRLDPFVDNRASAFFDAWHSDKIERAHWALGFEGRALYCVGHFVEAGHTRTRLFADPDIRTPELLATIPDTARYAIYEISPARTIPSFFNGLLATRSEVERRNILRLWERIQAENAFDAQRDILSHLGDHIVMHNDPPHPLHLPLAMTTLTEIREQPQQVRDALDRLCEAWRAAQLKHQEETGGPVNAIVNRDNDGIWFLEFAPMVAGPAWTVTDRFLITSWSPAALRSYLEKVGEKAGRRLPDR